MYAYANTLLSMERNDAFVLTLDKSTGTYQSCSIIPSLSSSNLGNLESRGNLSAKNNRILIQNLYYAGIQFPNQTVHAQDNNPGLCLTMFDYSGHLIAGIDYNSFHPQNRLGSISMKDSVLYLSNLLRTDATFGDISVSEQGYFSCVARYIDTSFMRCYVRQVQPASIYDAEKHSLVIYPNPTTNSLTIKSISESITKIAVYSASGVRATVSVDGTTINTAHLMSGIYILEITTINNKYHHKFIKQ